MLAPYRESDNDKLGGESEPVTWDILEIHGWVKRKHSPMVITRLLNPGLYCLPTPDPEYMLVSAYSLAHSFPGRDL